MLFFSKGVVCFNPPSKKVASPTLFNGVVTI
jgi:hypothetical protein